MRTCAPSAEPISIVLRRKSPESIYTRRGWSFELLGYRRALGKERLQNAAETEGQLSTAAEERARPHARQMKPGCQHRAGVRASSATPYSFFKPRSAKPGEVIAPELCLRSARARFRR